MDIRNLGTTPPPTTISNENGAAPSAPRVAAPVLTENAVQPPSSPVTMQQIEEAVRNINKTMQAQAQGVEFSIDADSDIPVVKVVDIETKEVLRQIPSEEALAIAKALDRAQGLLIRQKA